MLPQPVILESQDDTSMVDGATIEPRIGINRPDDENTRCRVSSVRDQPKDFSQLTQPPTTLSTSNVISFLQGHTEPFARTNRTWPSDRGRTRSPVGAGAILLTRLPEALLQRCWRVGILREFGAKGFRFSCWERIMPFKLHSKGRRHIPRQRHRVTNWREYDAFPASSREPDNMVHARSDRWLERAA